MDPIYRSAAEYLFSSGVFRFHREFRDGQLCDWIFRDGRVLASVYPFDGVCPERFDFCAATLVQAFAHELLRRPLPKDRPEGWADRYVFAASLLSRPVEIERECTD